MFQAIGSAIVLTAVIAIGGVVLAGAAVLVAAVGMGAQQYGILC